MGKIDDTKRLIMRKTVKYNMQLNQFLIAYEKILEKQLSDKQNEENFKGVYKNAKLLWITAYEMKIPQNHSVEEVIYFNLQKQFSSRKKTDNTDYLTKKKEAYRKGAEDRLLVSWVDRYYLKKKLEYVNDPNLPKPTKRMAFSSYKKKLEKMKWPRMTVNAIKEKYKRLTSRSED